MNKRYHVTLGGRRTTVTLDTSLSALVALKLGETPETATAHAAVRGWLQRRLDEAGDAGRYHVSQWLQGEAVLWVADTKLFDSYLDWLCRE
jgi:hypothetical protein